MRKIVFVHTVKVNGVLNLEPIDFDCMDEILEISACPIYRSITSNLSIFKIVIGVQHRQLEDKAGVDLLFCVLISFYRVLLLKYVLKEKSTSPKL